METTQKVYIVIHNNPKKPVYLYFIHMSTKSQNGSLNCAICMPCCRPTCTMLWPVPHLLKSFSHSQLHFRMEPLKFISFWCYIWFTELRLACLKLPFKIVACSLESLHIQCCANSFVDACRIRGISFAMTWSYSLRIPKDVIAILQRSSKWFQHFLPFRTEL